MRVTKHYLVWFIPILYISVFGCKSVDVDDDKVQSSIEAAIKMSVEDHSKIAKKKYPKSNIFFVNIKDINKELYSFSIALGSKARYNEKIELTAEDIERLPDNYLVAEGNFYYWYDDKNQKQIQIDRLKEYGYLNNDEDAFCLYFEEPVLDEKEKITYYYYCKNDLEQNRRVRSNKSGDYFVPPKNFECSN